MSSTKQRIQLKQLSQLLVIAEEGSFRKAADKLNLTQPALSRSIQALEKNLQVNLMERGPRGVVLTIFGETLVKHSKIIDSAVEYAVDDIDDMRGERSGVIKMGAGMLSGYIFAPQAITRLLDRRPDTKVIVVEGTYDTLTPQLLEGDLDFIFGPSNPDGPVSGLCHEIVANIGIVFAVREGHPLAKKKKVSFADLSSVPWIFPSQGSGLYQQLQSIFKNQGLPLPCSEIDVESHSLTKAMLLSRDLVAMIPHQIIHFELQQGLVRELPLFSDEMERPIYLVKREIGDLPPACRELITELRAVCEKTQEEN